MSFLRNLPSYGPARDAFLLDSIRAGKIDPPSWIPITIGRVQLEVSSDYLTIAGEHIPMPAYVAQAAVDSLGGVLPTQLIVDEIEKAAKLGGGLLSLPTWAPPAGQDRSAQVSAEVLSLCEMRTNAMFGTMNIQPGQLVAGHRKDVILYWYMPDGAVVIYGARWSSSGGRLQPVHPIGPGGQVPPHESAYADYSHGVRCVRNACLLDGAPSFVTDILAGPNAKLLGGPVKMLRYPPVKASSVGPSNKVLVRGMRGPDVKEVQELLCKAKFNVTVDGIFGRETEMNVSSFQAEYGLVQTGKVDVKTLSSLRGVEAPPSNPVDAIKATDLTISFVQAKNYYPGRRRPIGRICLHDMESARTKTTAENVAQWFAGKDAPVASTHYNLDCDSIVQSVLDEDTAFGAKGMNADAIHIELAGRASQSSAEWSDDYSKAMLSLATQLVWKLCEKWDIPKMFVDAEGLVKGEKGITTHAEVTKAFKQSTHTDPGPNFPIAAFVASVNRIIP